MLTLNRHASVVEYNSARVLIASCLNFAMYRVDDSNMVVMERKESHNSWQKWEENDDWEFKVTVDCGSFSQVLDLYTGKLRFSYTAEELIDFLQLLVMIMRRVNPEFNPEPSPYMGRGKSMNWMINQYYDELIKPEHAEKLVEMNLAV